MTDTIEQAAVAILNRVEGTGGTLAAIESGLIQREIQESAYRAQIAIDSGENIVVGVNRFREEGSRSPGDAANSETSGIFRVDPAVERRQIERLLAMRTGRDAALHRHAIHEVARVARDGGNLMPPIVEAVETKATLGEISEALRSVFGVFQETATV